MRKKIIYKLSLLSGLLLFTAQPGWAAGPPAPSLFSNPMIIVMVVMMLVLLIIIGILAKILIEAADFNLKKKKIQKKNQSGATAVILTVLLLAGTGLFAQDANPETTTTAAKTIAGMPATTFYIMTAVLFIELMIIIGMLINIKFLLKSEKAKFVTETATAEETAEAKRTKLSWWDRFNKLKPVSEEADLDLGHNYDGIRELDNRLPPWWIYGFYLTIVFAGIYLWRFHVSHTAPSSKQEYERSVARAEARVNAYLKSTGTAIDENNVTLLTSAEDLANGKTIFIKSCAACHQETGAGNVGPNLTDDYWLHGGDIKSIFKIIRYGFNAMPQWQNAYSNKQIAQLTSFVKSLKGTNPSNPKAQQGELYKEEAKPATDSSAVKENKTTPPN